MPSQGTGEEGCELSPNRAPEAKTGPRAAFYGRAAFWCVLCALFCGALFVASCFLFRFVDTLSRVERENGRPVSIEIVHRPRESAFEERAFDMLFNATFAFVALAVLAFLLARRPWRALAAMSIMVLPAAGLPVAFFKIMPSSWKAEESIEGPEGQTYCLLSLPRFVDLDFALTQRVRQTEASETHRVLAWNTNDINLSSCPLVLPRNSAKTEGAHLTRSESGWILGVYCGCCYVAYDPANAQGYGFDPPTVGSVSPFALLDYDSEPDERSIDRVRQMLRLAPSDGYRGRPTEAALREGLDHPNREVRHLAAEFLDMLTSASMASGK